MLQLNKKRTAMIDLSKINVSFYRNKTDTKSQEVMTLDRYFGEHPKLMDRVIAVRLLEDKKERDLLKVTLPGVTFSGTFRTREDPALIKHSGLVALDFDGLGDSLEDVKEYINNLPYILYCGLSVSARGLYALIRIGDPTHHREHYRSLEADFFEIGLKVDPTGINVSRYRIYSFDEHPYFNLNAEIYTRKLFPEKKVEPQYFQPSNINNTHLNRLCKMILQAPDGEKHRTLYKVARIAGGYVSSNTLNEDETIQALRNAISQREVRSLSDAYKTIKDGILSGLNSPIFENNKHLQI
jgi:hypothetical protein